VLRSQVVLEYFASDKVEEPYLKGKVILHKRSTSEQVFIETSAGVEAVAQYPIVVVFPTDNLSEINLVPSYECTIR
jgi:hypothetical protein